MLTFVAAKLRAAVAEWKRLPDALKLAWEASRGWTAVWAGLLLLQGLIPVASVYLMRPLVNYAMTAIRAGGSWETVRPALLTGLLVAAIALLAELVRSLAVWVRTYQSELAQDHINALIHRKSAEVDLAFYDSAEFYDRLHRARSEASYRPVELLEGLSGVLQNSVTLTAMIAVLAPFGPWLPLALLGGTLPALLVVLHHTTLQHRFIVRTTPDERRSWYNDWLLTSYEAASELRLFALGRRFQDIYNGLRRNLRLEKRRLSRNQALSEFAAGAVAVAVGGGCTLWMGWQAVRGLIDLGKLAMFYAAFQQGLGLMRALLQNLGSLYRSSMFLGNLFEFLELRPTVLSPAAPHPAPAALAQGIRFRNVSFRYPGSPAPNLADFNIAIPAGRIVSLVGPNGAGKSTFVKLLCRLYDPTEGAVEMDGVDMREFSLEELRNRITVLFQEPVRYNATVAESIELGRPGASLEEIAEAARAAGAEEVIARLPRRYDHLLGKLFLEGAGLSTGEWQRIALARAFLRQAPILVLDEPTSAMDPWAEAEWLDRFRAIAAGRTAILITHRLTTAMRADEIHVIANGRVVESGRHEDLLALGGLYAQSWTREIRRAEFGSATA